MRRLPWLPRGAPESALILLRRMLVPQFATLAVIVVIGSATVFGFGVLNDRQARAQDTLLLLEETRSEILAAQAGLRGYALVARTEFLDPYTRALPLVDERVADLQGRMSGRQRDELDEIDGLFDEWRAEFAEPVRAAVAERRDSDAATLIATGAGEARIDRIKRLAADLGRAVHSDVSTLRGRTEAFGWAAVVIAAGLAGAGTAVNLRLLRRLRLEVQVPLIDLAETATRLTHGDYSARADGGDLIELFTLATTFNRMAATMESTIVRLKEIDQLKSQFISSVSHELRTPLTSIRGYIEGLLEGEAGELNEEQREFAEIAYRNAGRLETLIGDLLLLSRLESGRVVLNCQRLDLTGLLTQLTEDLAPQIKAKPLQMTQAVADGLWVDGDRPRLQQIFANLLSNAVKFTPPHRGFSVRAYQREGEVVVEVADEGVGISADELSQIAQRFFRATSAAETEGSGLGLSITKELVELHGGRLVIESEEGAGSSFTVVLPNP
jgi:signal transduction histidine kinase